MGGELAELSLGHAGENEAIARIAGGFGIGRKDIDAELDVTDLDGSVFTYE
jgi:hypothetical protein